MKHTIVIVFSVAVIGIVVFIATKIGSRQIVNDPAIKGMSYDGGVRNIDNSGRNVASALDNIASDRFKDALADINAIINDESEPERIKKYFRDFLPLLEFGYSENSPVDLYDLLHSYDLSHSMDAKIFINDAPIICDYFSKNSKENGLAKAAVIPYWLIKHFYADDKSQKDNLSVYDEYIKKFVSGNNSFNVQSANVICLYVYAKCDAASKVKEYEELKAEIESFIKDYPLLQENGDMRLQRTYLVTAQGVLENIIKGENPIKKTFAKGFSKEYKLEKYPSSNL